MATRPEMCAMCTTTTTTLLLGVGGGVTGGDEAGDVRHVDEHEGAGHVADLTDARVVPPGRKRKGGGAVSRVCYAAPRPLMAPHGPSQQPACFPGGTTASGAAPVRQMARRTALYPLLGGAH